MDLSGGARKLIAELVKDRRLTVRRAEILSRDLAAWVAVRSQVSGEDLASFISDHAQVTDFEASTALLEALIERYLVEAREVIVSEVDVRNPALEAEIVAHPGEVAPYAVYADFLQERGDPFGEWIALGILADQGDSAAIERFERYRKLHEVRVFGGLGKPLTAVKLEWFCGMVRAIEQVGDMWSWKELLALRVCSAVQVITLSGCRPDAAELVASTKVRSIVVRGMTDEDLTPLHASEARTLEVSGRVATLHEALPTTLERLVWRVRETRIPAPVRLSIRELRLALYPDSSWLAQLALPELERLELELEHVPARDLPVLLGALAVPITELVLCAGRLDLATFATISGLPIAKRITKLALTELELTDEMLAAMVPGNFANLTEIDVSFNELGAVGVAHAKRFADKVISTRQHKRGSGNEQRVRRFAGSRLQAAEQITDPKLWRRAGIHGDLRWASYASEINYELYISQDLTRYACSCPSSIQPCKHVIALALVDARTPLRSLPPELGLIERVGGPRD